MVNWCSSKASIWASSLVERSVISYRRHHKTLAASTGECGDSSTTTRWKRVLWLKITFLLSARPNVSHPRRDEHVTFCYEEGIVWKTLLTAGKHWRGSGRQGLRPSVCPGRRPWPNRPRTS